MRADLSYKQFTKKELLKYSQPLYELEASSMGRRGENRPQFSVGSTGGNGRLLLLRAIRIFGRGNGIHAVLEHMGDLCNRFASFCIRVGYGKYLNERVFMETRLPMLNGYSRLEYQNMTGEDASSMGVFQKDQLEDDVETETPLYAIARLCAGDDVWLALSDHRGADQIQTLEQVTRKLKIHNNELDVLTAMACAENEKYTKACNILDDVADRTEDPSVISTIDILSEQAERILENNAYFGEPFMGIQKEMPYQREAPKVGRNDPCPCGSGKKYKKCCGK